MSRNTRKPNKIARGVRINVNGLAEFVYFDNARDRMGSLINNGFIELISLGSSFDKNSAHAYVDEDGIRKNLPKNNRATKILTNLLGAQTVDILGPVVFFGQDGEGEEANLPPKFVDAIAAEGGAINETGS